jgi:hypothetical protein
MLASGFSSTGPGIGRFAVARAVGVGQALSAGGAKQILVGEFFRSEQPVLDLCLGHDIASGEDVADIDSLLGQSAADQQTAMAIERIGLGAHQRDTVPFRRLAQLL